MAKAVFFGILLAVFLQCNAGLGYDDALGKHIKAQMLKRTSNVDSFDEILKKEYVPVYVAPQDGLKEGDKVESLPGQPSNAVPFDQYSGYVTVDPTAGRALFYYFAESPQNSSSLPLVLWLNGGPGCSSFGNGAMMELGPFRVKSDGLTLSLNQYAWNNVANIIFLESPAGVGFSYSNTTSDYKLSGDKKTAEDSYVFLVNWLERFPEYKTRDFFIAGESYAGHYAPQLAKLILHNTKNTNQTVINLKGIAIGNAWVDYETGNTGSYEYFWTHALISDETYSGIVKNCNFTSRNATEDFEACMKNIDDAFDATSAVFIYNIYAPFCTPSSPPPSTGFDPCSGNYISSYLNSPAVQNALHANVTSIPYPWSSCSEQIGIDWNDSPDTVLPVIQELMASGISVWMYSGDTDGRVPVTSTRQSINKMGPPVKTKWYPWYASEDEVGGYAIEYQNLTLVTIRGAGHFVPSYQPASAIAMFSSFLQGKLPPTNDHGI